MTFRAVRDCGQTHGQPVIDGTTSKLNVATTNTLQHLSCKTTDHCSAVQLTELFQCIAKSERSTLVPLTDLTQHVAPHNVLATLSDATV